MLSALVLPLRVPIALGRDCIGGPFLVLSCLPSKITIWEKASWKQNQKKIHPIKSCNSKYVLSAKELSVAFSFSEAESFPIHPQDYQMHDLVKFQVVYHGRLLYFIVLTSTCLLMSTRLLTFSCLLFFSFYHLFLSFSQLINPMLLQNLLVCYWLLAA